MKGTATAATARNMAIVEHLTAYAQDLDKFTAVDLRKLAQEAGIRKNEEGKRISRKEDIVRALVNKKRLELQAQADADAAKSKKVATRKVARKGKAKCADCGKRPVDPKTAGRDSTLCTECWEYAGEENQHNDDNHTDAKPGENCAVCRNEGWAAGDVPATSKAIRFAQDAEKAGWKAAVAAWQERGLVVSRVTATRGDETLVIHWDDKACQNSGTEHTGTDGKARKVRNASAARKILEG